MYFSSRAATCIAFEIDCSLRARCTAYASALLHCQGIAASSYRHARPCGLACGSCGVHLEPGPVVLRSMLVPLLLVPLLLRWTLHCLAGFRGPAMVDGSGCSHKGGGQFWLRSSCGGCCCSRVQQGNLQASMLHLSGAMPLHL